MNHIRVKVFPTLTDRHGHGVKYLQPRATAPRLYFPLTTIRDGLSSDAAI